MTPSALLSAIRAAGVEPVADGDRILLRPPGKLPDDLRAQVKAAKPEIIALLLAQTASAPEPCVVCGSTTWRVSLVDDVGRRTCAACVTGATALRRAGVSL